MRGLGIAARAAALLSIMIVCAAAPAFAAKPKYAAMVIDANTGKVLHGAHVTEPRYPASLTKMMTLYLIFEEVKRGKMTYSTRIKISKNAASAPPSKIGLKPGQDIALINVIKALVTKSANDISIAIAEHIAGSEAKFAQLMTNRARQLRMHDTTFRNASGLPDAAQVTTARDMITLALRLYDDFPKQFQHFSLRSFTYRGKTYRSHNTLMKSFKGMNGIKTGYTRASGFNLVSSVRQRGRHVMAVVFGGKTAASRNAHMRTLLKRGLAKASTKKTRRSKPVLVAKPVPVPRPAQKPALAQKAAQKTVQQRKPAPQKAHSARKPGTPAQIEILSVKRVRMPVAKPSATRPTQSRTPQHTAARPSPASNLTRNVATPPSATSRLARPPSTLNEQMALILSKQSAKPSLRHPHAPPQTAVAPARAPSTLQAQAAAIARASAVRGPGNAPQDRRSRNTLQRNQPAWKLRGPIEEPGVIGKSFEVQIGVFATAEEAEQRLAAAQRRIPALANHAALALPLQKGKRLMYRARFAGFEQTRAAAACNALRNQSIDCQVTRPE